MKRLQVKMNVSNSLKSGCKKSYSLVTRKRNTERCETFLSLSSSAVKCGFTELTYLINWAKLKQWDENTSTTLINYVSDYCLIIDGTYDIIKNSTICDKNIKTIKIGQRDSIKIFVPTDKLDIFKDTFDMYNKYNCGSISGGELKYLGGEEEIKIDYLGSNPSQTILLEDIPSYIIESPSLVNGYAIVPNTVNIIDDCGCQPNECQKDLVLTFPAPLSSSLDDRISSTKWSETILNNRNNLTFKIDDNTYNLNEFNYNAATEKFTLPASKVIAQPRSDKGQLYISLNNQNILLAESSRTGSIETYNYNIKIGELTIVLVDNSENYVSGVITFIDDKFQEIDTTKSFTTYPQEIKKIELFSDAGKIFTDIKISSSDVNIPITLPENQNTFIYDRTLPLLTNISITVMSSDGDVSPGDDAIAVFETLQKTAYGLGYADMGVDAYWYDSIYGNFSFPGSLPIKNRDGTSSTSVSDLGDDYMNLIYNKLDTNPKMQAFIGLSTKGIVDQNNKVINPVNGPWMSPTWSEVFDYLTSVQTFTSDELEQFKSDSFGRLLQIENNSGINGIAFGGENMGAFGDLFDTKALLQSIYDQNIITPCEYINILNSMKPNTRNEMASTNEKISKMISKKQLKVTDCNEFYNTRLTETKLAAVDKALATAFWNAVNHTAFDEAAKGVAIWNCIYNVIFDFDMETPDERMLLPWYVALVQQFVAKVNTYSKVILARANKKNKLAVVTVTLPIDYAQVEPARPGEHWELANATYNTILTMFGTTSEEIETNFKLFLEEYGKPTEGRLSKVNYMTMYLRSIPGNPNKSDMITSNNRSNNETRPSNTSQRTERAKAWLESWVSQDSQSLRDILSRSILNLDSDYEYMKSVQGMTVFVGDIVPNNFTELGYDMDYQMAIAIAKECKNYEVPFSYWRQGNGIIYWPYISGMGKDDIEEITNIFANTYSLILRARSTITGRELLSYLTNGLYKK